MYAQLGKPALDRAGAVLGLLVLAPVLTATALAVRYALGSPVLFRQERPGRFGRRFVLLKFRSMREPGPESSDGSDDGARLTRFGQWLRSTSLDELPELVNILRGDMSFVGPRPLLTEYLDRYTPEQARRHEVRPGITGWAQINGRNAQTWEERFALDVWYVDNMSLVLDLKILLLTIWKVLRREGVNAEGHHTMPKFEGRGRVSS